MKTKAFVLSLALFTAPALALAQVSSYYASRMALVASLDEGGGALTPAFVAVPPSPDRPFSRLALGGGFSPLGIHLLAATNVNRYLGLRVNGNSFQFSISSISTNGFNVVPKLHMASAGATVDFYPFPNHDFRLSPGALFYNTNGADATFLVPGGANFTMNNVNYYSSSTNPVQGTGGLNLHTRNPAFTITTGWGNLLPRKGGHWSFPFEAGVAFTGSPSLNMALNSGQVCDAQGLNCVDVATNQALQANLQAQIARYTSNLDPLKTFPILGGGIVYSFHLR